MLELVTCEVQVVKAHNRHVFVMSTVVNAPSGMRTLEQRSFITATVDIVQPNLTSSRSVECAGFHTEFPDPQHRCNNSVLQSSTMRHSYAASKAHSVLSVYCRFALGSVLM